MSLICAVRVPLWMWHREVGRRAVVGMYKRMLMAVRTANLSMTVGLPSTLKRAAGPIHPTHQSCAAHLRPATTTEKSVPSQRRCWGQNSVNTIVVPGPSVAAGTSKT
jgi:hypothetical protein